MEKSAILKADILDIIFEGRNKEYGAYELRRTYNKRLRISMLVMIAAVLLLFVGQLFAGKNNKNNAMIEAGPVIFIDPPPPPEEVVPPPPPPPKMPPPEPVKMKMYTPPVITNEDVKPDEKPLEMDELANTQIGTKNQDGKDDAGIVAPPSEDAVDRGVIEPPKKPKEDSLFMKVEIDAQYPGGPAKWQRFLQKNMDNNIPQSAIDNNISGTVMVEFIVDKEGNVSNVKATSGPEELKEFCISVIKKSGKWIPAIQNGDKVKSYKRQPIVIRLESN